MYATPTIEAIPVNILLRKLGQGQLCGHHIQVVWNMVKPQRHDEQQQIVGEPDET